MKRVGSVVKKIKCPPEYEKLLEDIRLLKRDDQNPNVMSDRMKQQVWSSLTKFGWLHPIVTNKEGLLADGEQRVDVCLEHEVFFAPVLRLHLKDVDRRLLRQTLNKLSGEHNLLADALEFEKIMNAGHEDDLKLLLDLNEENLLAYQYLNQELSDFDAEAEWVGMPEFQQENLPDRAIILHFKTDRDVRDFAKLIDQTITEKTKYLYFPKQVLERTAHLRYQSES